MPLNALLGNTSKGAGVFSHGSKSKQKWSALEDCGLIHAALIFLEVSSFFLEENKMLGFQHSIFIKSHSHRVSIIYWTNNLKIQNCKVLINQKHKDLSDSV